MQVARGDEIPSEDEVIWVIQQLLGSNG